MKEPKKRMVRIIVDCCCQHSWKTISLLHFFFVTFVSLPHDITRTNAAYSAMSGINLSNIIINSMGPSHKDTLGFFWTCWDDNETRPSATESSWAKHTAIATCSLYLFIVMLRTRTHIKQEKTLDGVSSVRNQTSMKSSIRASII